jgi:hypothetical protein
MRETAVSEITGGLPYADIMKLRSMKVTGKIAKNV